MPAAFFNKGRIVKYRFYQHDPGAKRRLRMNTPYRRCQKKYLRLFIYLFRFLHNNAIKYIDGNAFDGLSNLKSL